MKMSSETLCQGYVTQSRHKNLLIGVALLLLAAMAATGLSVGASSVGPWSALQDRKSVV